MRVGMIGAGLQGRRRGPVVKGDRSAELVVISAESISSAQGLADELGCEAAEGWESIVQRGDLDVIIIATPPDLHAEIAIAAMRAGKHVLCEKPLSRTLEEGEEMVRVARETGRVLKCGFNHRHHPAVWEAKRMLDEGAIGRPLFGRAVYGIGGRPDYAQEWRADPAVASGGHLMEQGIHAVDLFRWFFGDFKTAMGLVSNAYWKIDPLEDNGFALFQTAEGQTCSLHASLTQWKNRFTFEVFGELGYLTVEGLGASYGTEKLIYGKRDFEGPFSEQVTEFRRGDGSWLAEWAEFRAAIRDGRTPLGDGEDGLAAMGLVQAVYRSSGEGRAVDPNTLYRITR